MHYFMHKTGSRIPLTIKLSLLTNFVYCLKRAEMLPKRQSNNPATQDKVLIILKPMQSLNLPFFLTYADVNRG